jgi:hypothetical protein
MKGHGAVNLNGRHGIGGERQPVDLLIEIRHRPASCKP